MCLRMSWWNDLCEQSRLNHISKEEQEKVWDDLLEFLHVWDPQDCEELAIRVVSHPNVEVRMQLRAYVYAETCFEAPIGTIYCSISWIFGIELIGQKTAY